MLPFFNQEFGNPNSRTHSYGTRAAEAVEEARGHVAKILGASPSDIIFTSGSTEAINLTVFGIARAYREKGNHLITVATEHKAVLYSHRELKSEGFEITVLPVDKDGRISPDDVAKAITPKTILVSVMMANNEIGTIHPIQEIGKICKEKEVLFQCDAVQAVGKMHVDVEKCGIDLVPLSAHKIYGPKGVGALYIRKKNPRIRIQPMIFGGGHEKGMRSGTMNVTGIVGFGEACRLIDQELDREMETLKKMREKFMRTLEKSVSDVQWNGHPTDRIHNNISMSFSGVDGTALVNAVKDDIAISTGATCTSVTVDPSHVLTAIGLSPDLANATLRMGIGRFNTDADLDFAADVIAHAVNKLRKVTRVDMKLAEL
jgi:cysteine desulfurase